MGRNGLTALEAMETAELSLVKRGANKKGKFPIFKSEDGMTIDMKEVLENVLKTEIDGEKDFEKVLKELKVSEKGAGAATATLRILKSFKDEMPVELVEKLQEAAGIQKAKTKKQDGDGMEDEDEDENKFPDFKKKGAVKKWYDAMPEELQKQLELKEVKEEPVAKDNKELEAIMKSHKDEMAAMKAEQEKVTKALKDEREARELDGWIAKAEKELTHYPGKSSKELGEMLHKMHTADPEIAKEQFEAMKTTSETLQKSEMFREAGGVGFTKSADTGSAWDTIEKMADGLVQKSEDMNMTKAEAIRRVMDSPRGAELYNRYLKEHPKQTSAS